jgi:hypothetical protein
MARRMLIDASHPEETRVVVVDGTKLDEFDFETASRRPLQGNIYPPRSSASDRRYRRRCQIWRQPARFLAPGTIQLLPDRSPIANG